MGLLDNLLGSAIQDSTGFPARRLVRRIGAGKILMLGGAALAGAFAAEKLSGNAPPSGSYGGKYPGPGAPPPPPPPGAGTSPLPPVPGTSAGAAGPGPGAPPPPPPEAPPSAPAIPGETSAAPPPPPPEPASPAPPEAAPIPPPPGAPPQAGTEAPPVSGEDLPQPLLFAAVRTMVAAALADGELAAEERELIRKHLGEGGLTSDQVSQVHRDLVIPATPDELAQSTTDPQERRALYRAALLVIQADGTATDRERTWLATLSAALGITDPERRHLEADLLGALSQAGSG